MENEILTKLANDGMVIIPNVIDPAPLQTGMWTILSDLSSGKISKDPATWKLFYDLYPLHSMLIQHYSVGHHQVVWDARQNNNIENVFASIWGTKDLLVSFDGVSIHLPPETTKRGYFYNKWYHTDQSYTRNDFECVQGFVTAFDIRDGDATFIYLKNSHNYHRDIANEFGISDKSDWYKITDNMYRSYINRGCTDEVVVAPAGSLILWDSRLIHCGRESIKGRAEPNFRFVIYICMTPRSRASKAQLTKKKTAFENMRMTTHNPHKIKLFPKLPRTYGKAIVGTNITTPPVLAKKYLAGY